MEKAGDSATAGGDWKEDIRKGNFEFNYNRNYPKAEEHYNDALKKDPKNVAALVNLSFLYSEYMFDLPDHFKKSLDISKQIIQIHPDSFESRSELIEDLIQVGEYEEARKYAQNVIDTEGSDKPYERNSDFLNAIHTLDRSGYQILNRFFKLCSYMLERNNEKEAEEALKEFISYYRRLGNDFRIKEEQWIFNGLVKAIEQSSASSITKFLLFSLINLLAGKRNAMDIITKPIPS
jgi:tetratricopeptide (TPR) repeat protein